MHFIEVSWGELAAVQTSAQRFLQVLNVLLQLLNPESQITFAALLSIIHLLTTTVHHFGVGQCSFSYLISL